MKELTDLQIARAISLIRGGDGWDGDQWDLAVARAAIAADRALNAPADRDVIRQAMQKALAALELSRLRMTGSLIRDIEVVTDACDALNAALAAAPTLERITDAREPVEQPWSSMADAIAAGDGTLHGAIDHWQERALTAERNLTELRAKMEAA